MPIRESLSYVLNRAAVAHRNAVERKMKEIGLHSGQVLVLLELWEKDGQRQIDLAAALRLSAPTVNKILGGLIDGDYVTRARYEDDARSTRIFLTDKGRSVRPRVETKWEELEDEATIELTDTEHLMLVQLLRKLLERPEDLLM